MCKGRLRPRTLVSYSIPELPAKIMSFLLSLIHI